MDNGSDMSNHYDPSGEVTFVTRIRLLYITQSGDELDYCLFRILERI